MADSKSNPNSIGIEGGEYAGFVAPSRPDASTVGPGGLVVDRTQINKTLGGSGAASKPKPLGAPQSRPGY